MAVEYNAMHVVGFVFGEDDIPKKYRKYRKEESHLEARYDAKTAKRVADEKVIDVNAGGFFMLNAVEHDDAYSFFEHLADMVDGHMECHGDLNHRSSMLYCVEPPLRTKNCGYAFDDVVKSAPLVHAMHKKLIGLGFKQKPGVWAVLDIS